MMRLRKLKEKLCSWHNSSKTIKYLNNSVKAHGTVNCKLCAFFALKRRNMSDNIQTNTTGRLTPCLQQKIDKTRYLVEVHFSDTSTQSVEDKLKRVILHDLEHGKQENQEKVMNTSLTSSNRNTSLFGLKYPCPFIMYYCWVV